MPRVATTVDTLLGPIDRVNFSEASMRKLIALALLALALAGGVAVVNVEQSTPAHADGTGCGNGGC